MWFLLALQAWPLGEIGLFIELGGILGLWPTLGLIVLTAALGVNLLRAQGLRAQQELRAALTGLGAPVQPLAEGALMALAGGLLILPGFLTDTIGLALLIAPLRRLLLRRFGAAGQVQGLAVPTQRHRATGVQVIDGEFMEIDPENAPPRGESGWTRH